MNILHFIQNMVFMKLVHIHILMILIIKIMILFHKLVLQIFVVIVQVMDVLFIVVVFGLVYTMDQIQLVDIIIIHFHNMLNVVQVILVVVLHVLLELLHHLTIKKIPFYCFFKNKSFFCYFLNTWFTKTISWWWTPFWKWTRELIVSCIKYIISRITCPWNGTIKIILSNFTKIKNINIK